MQSIEPVESGPSRIKAAAVPRRSNNAARRKATRLIRPGDLVILFISRDRPPTPICVTPGATYINSFGVFPHDSLIGRPFGSVLYSTNGKGFITVLRPNPELWTLSLPHRTQILYAPDMSFIALKLGLTPGARVAEAGTGSGSFTHFLARCVARSIEGGKDEVVALGRGWKGQEGMGVSTQKKVQTRPPKNDSDAESNASGQASPSAQASLTPPFKDTPMSFSEDVKQAVQQAKSRASPTTDDTTPLKPEQGKVWSFEFHAERAKRARIEFESHGICPSVVSLSHRNVCLHGFPSELDARADAVFLDLPAPWEAIPFLPSLLNPRISTRVCCFSPCIEQVLRTVKALNNVGFKDVETYESLVRTHESVYTASGGGIGEMPLKGVEEVQQRLVDINKKKEKVSEGQRMRAKEKKEKEKQNGDEMQDEEESHEQEQATNGQDANGGERNGESQPRQSKRARTETQDAGDDVDDQHDASKEARRDGNKDERPSRSGPTSTSTPSVVYSGHGAAIHRSNTYSRVYPVMRGHTSYLTFATLLPRSLA